MKLGLAEGVIGALRCGWAARLTRLHETADSGS
jgi:hypothetical protein